MSDIINPWAPHAPSLCPWMHEACIMLGVREVRGPRHTAAIVELWKHLRATVTDDETPWCAAFVGACLARAGYPHSGEAKARSYLHYGAPVESPRYGDIAVLWRGNKYGRRGHVGFFLRREGRYIWLLGGNQRNRVCAARYPVGRLLAYRWPTR